MTKRYCDKCGPEMEFHRGVDVKFEVKQDDDNATTRVWRCYVGLMNGQDAADLCPACIAEALSAFTAKYYPRNKRKQK